MKISIIVCTHRKEMKEHLIECINSLLNQTYPTEIICVVDGDEEYYKELQELFNQIKLILNQKNMGLNYSRNRGVEAASNNIVAFIDDDAVADPEWVEELARCYWEGAIASGGKILPRWLHKKVWWLPEEFYWMAGVTHKGFADKKGEVRNTFGSNLSFKKEIFNRLEGFKLNQGMKKNNQMQASETDLCDRMNKVYGRGVMYNPNALVYHKVFKNRTKLRFLFKRAFWQGWSKAEMKSSKLQEERSFLKEVLYSPVKTGMLIIFSATVVTGYGINKCRAKLFR